ncbi:uncharacterized protein TNCV_2918461 [Trichonephila clavipes]|nr:uncharacterized protein TNCV_2918461 [Trichonephila clavipes]
MGNISTIDSWVRALEQLKSHSEDMLVYHKYAVVQNHPIALLEKYGMSAQSIAEHNSYFANLLKRACSERPMVILLDGLDQVEEYSGRSLKWFPAVLPQHVKLVLALREGSSELQELQERLPEDGSTFLEIPDLEIEESLCIIEHLLRIKGRRLTDTQLSFIRICVTDNSYPRYAHVFAHVACTWHSLAIPERFWIRHSVYDIFCDYINEISKTVSISKVKKFLGSLATLKHGMTESEIFQVLQSSSEQAGADSDFPLPYIYLKHHLSAICRTSYRRDHKFTHYKCQLLRKLCKTYLGKEYLEECLRSTMTYFDTSEENNLMNGEVVKNVIKTNHKHQRWRELEEITHLQIKLNLSVRKNFFRHQWLYERVTSGDVYLLLEEIKMYKRRNPDDREIDILRKFLQLSAYALRIDGKQLYSQFYGRSKGYFSDPESNIKYPKVKKLIRYSITPPVPSFHTSGPCMRTLLDAQKLFPSSSKNKDSLDRMSWLDRGSTYLVTYSSSKGEIVGWNVNQTKQMVTFKEEECVVGLKTLGINAEVLVLHHNQMEVVDLTKSIVKTRMKELIDVSQGVIVLDGGKSILAISEGHDEILRFDTCSGHVANRIFAGEDKQGSFEVAPGNFNSISMSPGLRINEFERLVNCKVMIASFAQPFVHECFSVHRQLDCLLVSDNGEVCVSGDAVQKPYPLYAWNVESGVLLRHFAIPHHEFQIRLSLLNDDGRMLFATIKELLDSTPSFLLVYDTTTGSILWEAKPNSNISAISLCYETDRVIAATEMGTIHAWDLHTGDEAFAILANANRVNKIETAKNRTFITWDPSSQSRCIQVWNTITGKIKS